MKANIYLKISGIVFLAVGLMELFEQHKLDKEKSEKEEKQLKGKLKKVEIEIPRVHKLDPLVRFGQA